VGSFNPRARVGRDFQIFHYYKWHLRFQSTRPRGARRQNLCRRSCHSGVSIHAPAWGATMLLWLFYFRGGGFNPRARVGRDLWC